MRKPIKIAAILCVAGLFMILLAFVMTGFKLSGFSNIKYEQKEYTCQNETKEINLNNGLYNVEILKEKVDRIKIEYNDEKDNKQFEIEENGSVLNIGKINEKKVIFIFDISSMFNDTKRKMKITIPENFEGKMSFSGGAGDIKAHDLKMEALDINMAAGEVDLGDTQVDKEANIEMSAGSLNIRKLTVDHAIVDISAGDIKIGELIARGNVDIKASMGDIDVDRLEAKDRISIDCDMGDIKARIKGKKSDYNIHTDVSMGDCNLSNQTGGTKSLDIKLDAGDVDVDFTE